MSLSYVIEPVTEEFLIVSDRNDSSFMPVVHTSSKYNRCATDQNKQTKQKVK